MELSVPGLMVCLALALLGLRSDAPVLVALMVSLAFGSTAVATLPALGGNSPLIYVVFAGLLVGGALLRRDAGQALRQSFADTPLAGLVVALTLYGVGSAVFFPRLFEGWTSVFVVSRSSERVMEVPLAAGASNVAQAGYLALHGMVVLALLAVLVGRPALGAMRTGLLAFCAADAGLGLVDWIGKLAGAGDVLLPIRTANYSMLTAVEQAGFSRLSGGFPEASSFGATTLACLAYAVADARATRSPASLGLAGVLLVLLLLSTSSTAYLGLGIVGVPVLLSLAAALAAGRATAWHLAVLAGLVLAITGLLGLWLARPALFAPVADLFQTTVLSKADSASGAERSYWNVRSLQSVLETYGMGVGLGSSRASSWPVAVLSQLGIAGGILMALILAQTVRGAALVRACADPVLSGLFFGARACVLAGVAAASISAGSANLDLGLMVSVAAVVAARREAVRRLAGQAAPARPIAARNAYPDRRGSGIRPRGATEWLPRGSPNG